MDRSTRPLGCNDEWFFVHKVVAYILVVALALILGVGHLGSDYASVDVPVKF